MALQEPTNKRESAREIEIEGKSCPLCSVVNLHLFQSETAFHLDRIINCHIFACDNTMQSIVLSERYATCSWPLLVSSMDSVQVTG